MSPLFRTPIADLKDAFQVKLSNFLIDQAKQWQVSYNISPQRANEITDLVKQSLSPKLYRLCQQRLREEQSRAWAAAYSYSGSGSSKLRASAIEGILRKAAPLPKEVPLEDLEAFVSSITQSLVDSIISTGGDIKNNY